MAETTTNKDKKARARMLRQYKLEYAEKDGGELVAFKRPNGEVILFNDESDAIECKKLICLYSDKLKKYSRWVLTTILTRIEPSSPIANQKEI